MRQRTKNYIVIGVVFLYVIFMAVKTYIQTSDASVFKSIGVLVGSLLILYITGYALSKWSRDFKKLIDTLPADNKLITQHIAAINIGNYRFIYRIYEKGNINNPLNKTYITMEVGIPFPSGNDVAHDHISHLF